MAQQVKCESVSQGLRDSEVVASFHDYFGKRHFIRVESDFLSTENGVRLLPIGVVTVDKKTGLVLIEFPHEAETGANRVWVKPEQLDEPVEAFA